MINSRATQKPADAEISHALTSHEPALEIAPLELPDFAARVYLSKFAVGVVYVISGPHGSPCLIGAGGADLADALTAARRRWPHDHAPVLAAAWWCFDRRTAQQVAVLAMASDLCHAQREGLCLAVTLVEATAGITAAAGRLRFRLTDHATVLARIRATGFALEGELTAAQEAGQLKTFNQEYAKRRRAAQAAGKRFPHYSIARARLRALLAAAADGRDDGGDILKRVFDD
jgi:hypothetical protein